MIELRGVGFAWAVCGVSALLLAGCGGGGGGGGGSGAVAALTPTAATSKAVTVFLPAGSTISSAPSAMMMPSSAGAFATGTNTASVTGGLPNGAGSYTQILPAASCTSTSTDLNCGTKTDSLYLTSQAGSKGTLFYSVYGLTANDVIGAGNSIVGTNLSGVYAGTATALTDMPKNVTATYTGIYQGTAFQPGAVYAQAGNANLSANFGSGTVSGQVSNLTQINSAGTITNAGYGISMNGTISGGNYNGTAGYTTTTGAAAGTVSSSTLAGGFYGPQAAETAGALAIKGTTPTGTATTVVGAFGAKKN
jgi:C-lobe and N-lobe beta barrels of Tf-binding protein B